MPACMRLSGQAPLLARLRLDKIGPSLAAYLICLLVALLSVGCAGLQTPPPLPEPLFNDALFGAPAEPVDSQQVLALSPAMREFIAHDIRRASARESPQRALLDALYSPQQLRLEYDAGSTRNAAQAFAARAGNCLSLVLMTAAFAQAMDLDVSFNSALLEETWSRRGKLLVRSGHVNLTLGPRPLSLGMGRDTRALTVDFLPAQELQGLRSRAISLATVLAMYFNNRAAETLVQGDLDQAYAFARAALRHDAGFVPAYNTLGLVYRHHGDNALAAKTFEYALTLDDGQRQAMANLIDTLDALGKPEQAQHWRAALVRLEPYPPMHFLDQGRAAAAAGDWSAARALFERELARADYSAEVHFWLAQACLKLGDSAAARRHLQLASENSSSPGERALYAAKLDKLNAARLH